MMAILFPVLENGSQQYKKETKSESDIDNKSNTLQLDNNGSDSSINNKNLTNENEISNGITVNKSTVSEKFFVDGNENNDNSSSSSCDNYPSSKNNVNQFNLKATILTMILISSN